MPPFACAHKRHSGSRPESSLWTGAAGNRQLQGMSEELVRSFSKRTDQIDTGLNRLAADGRKRTPRLVKWAVQPPSRLTRRAAALPQGGVELGGGHARRANRNSDTSRTRATPSDP